jgi:Periplasmic binding protein-like domain
MEATPSRLHLGAGFPRYWHSKLRTDALAGAAGIKAVSVAADYTAEHGAEATRDLLKQAAPPTAILYDNDVMALAGLGAAQRMGVRVPAGPPPGSTASPDGPRQHEPAPGSRRASLSRDRARLRRGINTRPFNPADT